MIHISIQNEFKRNVSRSSIQKIPPGIFSFLQITDDPEMSIVINGDDFIQSLNREYRGIDEPTDVLSFSSDEKDPQTGKRYFGDIIISYPRAFEQAEKGLHSVADELTLLVIHGVLHLLGYDHEKPDDKEIMWKIQEELMKEFGIKIAL